MLSAIRAARSMTKVASVPNPSLYTPDVAYRLHFYCNAPRYSGVSVPSCQTIASGFSYSLVSSPNFVWKVRDSNPQCCSFMLRLHDLLRPPLSVNLPMCPVSSVAISSQQLQIVIHTLCYILGYLIASVGPACAS